MDYILAIKMGIQFIEENIDRDITLHDVAKNSYYSPYHYSKIFLKYTGITLGNYIKIRKIDFASSQLLYSRKSLIDISASIGYRSYEAFSREIKERFGRSPFYFRKSNKISYLMNHSYFDEALLNHVMNHLKFIPEEITLSSFEVIGMLVTTSLKNNQLDLQWANFNAEIDPFLPDTYESFAICESSNALLADNGDSIFNQFLCYKKKSSYKEMPMRFKNKIVEGGNYAIFKHTSTYHSLDLTYRYIWNIWIHSYQGNYDATRKSFEHYIKDTSFIHIYIPIK
jgi:AraC family transcriptional regulator